MDNHYSTRIHWSEQDATFIACVDELPGCIADGKTPIEALSNFAIIIEEWIEVAKEDGRPIPEAMTMEALDQTLRKSREDLERQIKSHVVAAVSKALNGAEEKTSVPAAENPWPETVGNV
jgi:predicted RNase H-like HicB family nuclease